MSCIAEKKQKLQANNEATLVMYMLSFKTDKYGIKQISF